MKRLHVNLLVKNIEETTSFYNALFNSSPTVEKPDYTKWMLEDPKVNFSISLGSERVGLNHLGIQVENQEELKEVYANISKADAVMEEEGHTVCCYTQSEKAWVNDPQNVKWEAFHSYGQSDVNSKSELEEAACCGPECCN